MNQALEKIIHQIKADSEERMSRYQAEKKAEINEIVEKEKEKITQAEFKQIEKNRKKVAKETRLARERQSKQMRQRLLQEKQQRLDDLFQELIKEMIQWDAETFRGFVASMLQQTDVVGEATVLLGEYSHKLIDQEWLSQFDNDKRHYLLSEEMIPGQGGFIIRQGRIEYNSLFSTLVADLKEKESYEVSQKLFQ